MSAILRRDDPILSSSEVRTLCGNISQMTLWRWRKYMGFPEPFKIATRNYWQLSEVNAWLENKKK
jgi:predicted DNA-binding transcriptional regulator AlpA